MMNEKRFYFLTEEIMPLLEKLESETVPSFGIMTPQHMIEHLILITKTTIKRYGEPNSKPSKGQLGFKKFIANGAVFKYFPKDKTVDDLLPLKYGSLEASIEELPIAVNRFYTHFNNNPSIKSYHPMMGELGFEELELFHFQHYRFHFWQFGLIPEF